jgi:rhodanese-related sulfurtransferase
LRVWFESNERSQQETPSTDVLAVARGHAHPAWRRRGSIPWRGRSWIVGAGLVVAVALLIVAGTALLGARTPDPTADQVNGVVVQASGGHWTNVTPDTLAAMLRQKDFTLLNVKTPYSGEIAGTDLYIPYDELAQRASDLPTNKTTRIVVYCRSGHESAMAAQTLLDLGYRNIVNLDGGMSAWTASGRQLITVDRAST